MRRQRPRRARRRIRRGTAMIEMALVLPLFLTIVLGIVEFGQMILVSHVLTNATRDAARSASLPGSTNSEISASVKGFLKDASKIDAEKVTVTITVKEAPGNADSGNDLEMAHRRDRVTVRAEVTFSEISWITPFFLTNDTKLSGHCAMRRE